MKSKWSRKWREKWLPWTPWKGNFRKMVGKCIFPARQCQNGEKWSKNGSLLVRARLGFHFSKINISNLFFISFWVSISKKNGIKRNQEWSEKWMKNGWKRPTVNDPNKRYAPGRLLKNSVSWYKLTLNFI